MKRTQPDGLVQRAVGYVRVSTQEQADQGVSLEAQAARIRAYADLNGLDLVEVYVDNGVSGGKPIYDREGGRALLDTLKRKEAAHIISVKLDRLFRNTRDCLDNATAWDKAGVGLHIIDMGGQSLNTRSATGKFVVTMLAALSELERGLISERTTAALGYMKENLKPYAPTPMGYTREGETLIANAPELATVKRAQALRSDGLSYRGIADTLNAEGAQTKNGGKWYASTVRYVCLNELYV